MKPVSDVPGEHGIHQLYWSKCFRCPFLWWGLWAVLMQQFSTERRHGSEVNCGVAFRLSFPRQGAVELLPPGQVRPIEFSAHSVCERKFVKFRLLAEFVDAGLSFFERWWLQVHAFDF